MPDYQTKRVMTRNDLFVDLVFDQRTAGSMLRDDWDALLVCDEVHWPLGALRDFIEAQGFKTSVNAVVIAVNVKRHLGE